MQRGSIINFNNVGRVSYLLLLAIVGLAVSPVASMATYAEESGAETTGEDPSISTYSTEAPSDIQIGFSPTTASSTVTPVDGNISSVYADVVATVSLVDTGGYSVYLGTNKDNTLRNGDHTITPISESDCDSGVCDLDDIPINKWGYSFQEVQSDDTEAKHTDYQAVPYNLRETALDSGKEAKTIQKKYALSFAANVNSTTASGTYTGSVTMSVVSSPRQVVFDDITTMQQMTNAICEKAEVGDAKQLEDVRDGKFYWVGKMPDNRCWMTQNLDLDLFTDVTLKGDTTNLSGGSSATWKPAQTTTTDGSTIHSGNDGQWSWSMGGPVVKPDTAKADYGYTSTNKPTDYYTTNPDSTTSCGDQLVSVASCNSGDANDKLAKGGWTQMDVPLEAGKTDKDNAHRLLGNLYQWCAATAGCTNGSNQTGSSFASGEAASSICPYGWKLPTSNTNGDFQKLTNALGATGDNSNIVKNLTDAPFYAVRDGRFYQDDSNRFYQVGYNGYYWSSTAYNTTRAYVLYFGDTVSIYPSNDSARQGGFSVRCINDPTKQVVEAKHS